MTFDWLRAAARDESRVWCSKIPEGKPKWSWTGIEVDESSPSLESIVREVRLPVFRHHRYKLDAPCFMHLQGHSCDHDTYYYCPGHSDLGPPQELDGIVRFGGANYYEWMDWRLIGVDAQKLLVNTASRAHSGFHAQWLAEIETELLRRTARSSEVRIARWWIGWGQNRPGDPIPRQDIACGSGDRNVARGSGNESLLTRLGDGSADSALDRPYQSTTVLCTGPNYVFVEDLTVITYLEHRSYRVRTLESVGELDQLPVGANAAADRPEVILSTVDYPGQTGWGAIRNLKADSRTGEIPIIAAACRADDLAGFYHRAVAAGCAGAMLYSQCDPHDEIQRVLAGSTME